LSEFLSTDLVVVASWEWLTLREWCGYLPVLFALAQIQRKNACLKGVLGSKVPC
jgi:hypothetical protein